MGKSWPDNFSLDDLWPLFQLLDLDVSVTDMTIDWISRTVYIASVQKLNGTSIILSYQLDEGQQEVQVMRSGVEITSLVREPYSR